MFGVSYHDTKVMKCAGFFFGRHKGKDTFEGVASAHELKTLAVFDDVGQDVGFGAESLGFVLALVC